MIRPQDIDVAFDDPDRRCRAGEPPEAHRRRMCALSGPASGRSMHSPAASTSSPSPCGWRDVGTDMDASDEPSFRRSRPGKRPPQRRPCGGLPRGRHLVAPLGLSRAPAAPPARPTVRMRLKHGALGAHDVRAQRTCYAASSPEWTAWRGVSGCASCTPWPQSEFVAHPPCERWCVLWHAAFAAEGDPIVGNLIGLSGRLTDDERAIDLLAGGTLCQGFIVAGLAAAYWMHPARIRLAWAFLWNCSGTHGPAMVGLGRTSDWMGGWTC